MTLMRSFLCTAAGTTALLFAGLAPAWADGFTDPMSMDHAIKGTMNIEFSTRTTTDDTGDVPEGSPALGAGDIYTTDLEIMNSVLLQGTITRLPWLPSSILGRTYQDGYLDFSLRWILRNPNNLTQTVTLGGWVGALGLDGEGKYLLSQPPEGKGRLRNAIDSIGNITGFVANYGGEIQGRVPEQAGLMGFASRASRQVNRTYARYVDGEIVSHTVEGADPLSFNNVILAQGPLSSYPETRVSGNIDYDGEEGIWYVDLTANYSYGGSPMTDRYSGTIRWNEDPNRMANGLGYYDINVRVNEQQVQESDIFAEATGASEDAFFSASASVPGYTGRISYVDKFSDETVIASKVDYDVNANSVSKIQTVNFAKVLMLMVGPFNDE